MKKEHIISERSFASDNNAGVHPEVLKALQEANKGHVIGYGDDPYTERAIQKIKSVFGVNTQVAFVYGGTGANILGLNALVQSYHSIVCSQTAHIYVDECGAPEKVIGCALRALETPDGKLTPEIIKPVLTGFDFEHHSQPKVISISQPTEMGTVYTAEEILALRELADRYNMYLHMDGARLANAAAALGVSLAAISVDAGVDVLSFGGTKNGLMFGEAVLFFRESLFDNVKYLRKQNMQLHSKMRFISCQFEALLTNELWLRNAENANKMARLLAECTAGLPGVRLTQKVETNAVFVQLEPRVIRALRERYFFYDWNVEKNEVRWMCAFDTTAEDVERFTATLEAIIHG